MTVGSKTGWIFFFCNIFSEGEKNPTNCRKLYMLPVRVSAASFKKCTEKKKVAKSANSHWE